VSLLLMNLSFRRPVLCVIFSNSRRYKGVLQRDCYRHERFIIQRAFTTVELTKLRTTAPIYIDLVFCYKFVFGLVSINFSDYFRVRFVLNTRGYTYK